MYIYGTEFYSVPIFYFNSAIADYFKLVRYNAERGKPSKTKDFVQTSLSEFRRSVL